LAVEGKTMNRALLELYRHKTWATLRLIAFCEGLAGDHLDATVPGTFGTIRDTLRHLVDSEEGYLSIVTRQPFRTKEAAAAFTRPDQMPDGPIPLDELAERIRRMGPQWETLAQDPDLPDREVTTTDGFRIPAALPMAQAIHHADDHRTQVLSILGARGLEVPELGVWEYDWSVATWQQLPGTST
jgi:uncharacterized damage-inducible protein DinB